MESERNFCLEPLRLVLQQLKSSKNCKKSELELLKFCLNSVINSSKSDKFNCKQYFDILFDVFKYSISILIENKVNEFSFTLYQQLYCDILQISLLELLNCEWKEACYEELHKLLDFSLKCFNVMEKEDTVQEEEKLQIINALSYILDVVKAINGKLSGQILIYVQSYFINLCKSLQIILQHTNNTVTAHLMIYIFKKLYVMDNECSMLKSTWNTISSFFEYKENDYLQEKHTTTYLILCCIMEHFSPEKPMPFFTREKLFWDIVNHGLKHSNSISRKRAMFILKWILNWCDTNCKRGECINLANLFYWYSSDDDLRIAWEDLTVILETLEEKQTHIIKPLLPKIDNLVMITNDKLSSNHLHSSWIMVVFHRMFHHESKYVVKWAITYFLNLNLASFSCLMTQIEKFLPTLLETLNDASLYSRSPSEPIGTCSSIGLAVGEFFKTSFYILGIKDKQVQFFNYLLTCIHQLSWGGVALFYISHALCKIPSTSLWNESSVDKIKELILNSLRTQDLLLRGAIQTFFMKSFYQLIDMEKLSLEDISKLLIVLKRNECFCRGTSLWDATIVWLKELFDKNKRITSDINRFVIDIVDNYISCKDKDETVEISFPGTSNSAAVARIIVLFADAYNISKETKHNKMYDNLIFNKLLKSIVDILASAKSRPYLPVKNINFCLDLISNLLIETKVNNHNSTQFSKNVLRSDIREILIKLLSPHINEILHLISKYILHPFTQFQNIEILRTYIAIFEMIVEERNFISIWPTIQSYVQQCIQRILEEQKSTDTVNFVCWNYLVCVCKSSVFAEMHKNHIKKEILNMIKSYINMNCLRNPFSKPNIPNDRISQAFWRELTSNAECAIWQCIEYYLRNEKDEIIIDYLEKNSMHFLETGSSKAIVFLFKCLHHVLPRVKNKCA
ncbi:uncharacterized protein LOC111625154 isoform X2 [Centruroides sculpturatus]|uniref:uncharacterized protein LOC111625154 isoform X2 n=1 Tax=Centruroides sculpturatus TaxID=218467 RepID=UPI000C6DBC96|nr:uncharacterized protein LOC111625154 isoform X2 [Centruroides sculpturatus]